MRGTVAARAAAVLAVVLAACTEDVDPAWQLDHDRVIAVRATPPRIAAGEIATIDALLGRKGAPPLETTPDTAEVESPRRLTSALVRDGERWTVRTPDEAELDAARAELALAPGEPVPLRLRLGFAGLGRVAFKIVWLGEHADNPVISPVTIGGGDGLTMPAFMVPVTTDVPLAVEFDDDHNINWLTSCGTMHDFDLARAYLRVELDDPRAGTLAVVVRAPDGGVDWRLWQITAVE